MISLVVNLGMLVILILISTILYDLTFRYYFLIGFFLIRSIISLYKLIVLKELREQNIISLILHNIVLFVLAFLVTIPLILFPETKQYEPTGTYQVLSSTETFIDESRLETYAPSPQSRFVNVAFWYPETNSETFPLIVFSHGAFGINTSNETLYLELASRGYVVASIDHPYHSFYTEGTDNKRIWISMDYMNEVQREDSFVDKDNSFELYQKWMSLRMSDINFVIDLIKAKTVSPDTDTLYSLIDVSKIGVMGHSLGGSAVLGIGRERNDISAVIALESPFLNDIIDVEDDQFIFDYTIYSTPLLNIYSDSGWNILYDRPQYEENVKLLQGDYEDIYNVHITGVGHLTLTDFGITSPILTQMMNGFKSTKDTRLCLEIINELSISFFDFYLKEDGIFNPSGVY